MEIRPLSGKDLRAVAQPKQYVVTARETRGPMRDDEIWDAIVSRYHTGQSAKAIAQELGLTTRRVKEVLDEVFPDPSVLTGRPDFGELDHDDGHFKDLDSMFPSTR